MITAMICKAHFSASELGGKDFKDSSRMVLPFVENEQIATLERQRVQERNR